jgi:hypothetical protein
MGKKKLTPFRVALAASLAFLVPLAVLEAPPKIKRAEHASAIAHDELAISAAAAAYIQVYHRPLSTS